MSYGQCKNCIFWGPPLAHAKGYCAREGAPFGNEQTGPDQGCELFEALTKKTPKKKRASPKGRTNMKDKSSGPAHANELVIGAPGWETRVVPIRNFEGPGFCVALYHCDDPVLQVVEGRVETSTDQGFVSAPACALIALLRRAGRASEEL